MKALQRLIVLAVALGIAAPSLAQTGQAATSVAPADAAAAKFVAPASTSKATTPTQRLRSVQNARSCIRATGSHIRPPKGGCLAVPGNSYSREDLQRTGSSNLGQALKMLDPSVTVSGH